MKKKSSEEDFIYDDITFCYYSECSNKECFRHSANIRLHYVPHSFGFFKDCEYWDLPEVSFRPSDSGVSMGEKIRPIAKLY